MRETTSRHEVSRIQHLGTSNSYYFSQYHVVFVYNLLSTEDSTVLDLPIIY